MFLPILLRETAWNQTVLPHDTTPKTCPNGGQHVRTVAHHRSTVKSSKHDGSSSGEISSHETQDSVDSEILLNTWDV